VQLEEKRISPWQNMCIHPTYIAHHICTCNPSKTLTIETRMTGASVTGIAATRVVCLSQSFLVGLCFFLCVCVCVWLVRVCQGLSSLVCQWLSVCLICVCVCVCVWSVFSSWVGWLVAGSVCQFFFSFFQSVI
jgi:hypothetical protein